MPFEELVTSDKDKDPLAFALSLAATQIPVVIPSGNIGTSKLSFPIDCAHFGQWIRDLGNNVLKCLSEELRLDAAKLEKCLKTTDDNKLRALFDEESPFITVGACNNKGYRSRYSQYGPHLTVVAPSDDETPAPGAEPSKTLGTRSIATTDIPGPFGYSQGNSGYTNPKDLDGMGGTSAAGAQVAGIIALMLEANRNLKARNVRRILQETAKTDHLLTVADVRPEKPSMEFGAGLVDAGAAVAKAQQLRR